MASSSTINRSGSHSLLSSARFTRPPGEWKRRFASKLVASVDPNMPVIDAFVLKNLDLRLPRFGRPLETRLSETVELHDLIGRTFAEYLDSDLGRHLVARFEESYPGSRVTPVKMLDLVLWQVR